jgi:ATP-dependent helicase/nuclease subunit B
VSFQALLPFDEEPSPDAPRSRPSARLVEELAQVCRDRALEEKVLVAPTLAVGYQLVERLAREGSPWVNLRVETARTLAHAVVGPDLVREGVRVLSRAQSLALVEQACAEVFTPGSYFGSLAGRPGLHRALERTLEELRAAGISFDRLPAVAFSDRRKSKELREVFRRHAASLEAGRYADGIEILRRATEALAAGGSARPDALFLVVAPGELSGVERRFLQALAGEKLETLPSDPPEEWSATARHANLFRAVGEENEIREVFRRILSEGVPFDDVEILHTDARVYPALAWELSREHDVPCTFAGGIAVTYTRPGRAALAFLDWIGQDFASDVLREALASGALTLESLPAEADAPGARGAARALRAAGIGWGRERHRRRLDALVESLGKPETPRRDEDEPSETERRAANRRRRAGEARRAREFVRRALELAPRWEAGPGDLQALAAGVRGFVAEFGRVADELDGAARTALDALFQEFEELAPVPVSAAEAVERLREAVAGLAVAPDRPRAGRVHVAPYRRGGHSGRAHTFLVGLDAERHPGRDLEDPVLLDEERRRINEELSQAVLPLGRERPREESLALRSLFARLRGSVTASYSGFDLRNLSQSGEPAPSPFFLEIFRAVSGLPEANYEDLARALPPAAGFVPGEEAALDETEWWLSRAARHSAGAGAGSVRARFPWLEEGRRAEEARESETFTIWDGWVRSGAPELDPRRPGGEPFSASRIEALARCPFAYFVKHVLGVVAPDDLERDPSRWLSPLDEGSLLHETFRIFFERITEAGEKPESSRHREALEKIAAERIAEWRERVPPRSQVAFDAQRESILFACSTLLRLEEAHCQTASPRYFEVPFGRPREVAASRAAVASADPVEIPLPGGKRFLLRGSIDRVDQAPDGTFHVWDYKTGALRGIREGGGVRGGRQIQPVLYAAAFEALLARAGQTGRVSTSGYFFPGWKGEGQRISSAPDRKPAGDVLTRLFDLVAAGMFPHAVFESDCRYCDFEPICGGAKLAGGRADGKLANASDPVLIAYREMHAEEE